MKKIIDTIYIKSSIILSIILFLIGFLWPLIVVKKSGSDPHGTHEGFTLLTQLSSVSIFLWLGLMIFYLFFNTLIESFWCLNFLFNDIVIIIGMICILIGFILEILGIYALGINFRIELPTDETELITSGVYRIMRNPIVFGIFLIVIGSFLMIPTIIFLIICVFNIITFNSKAMDEEKFLIQRFGDEYRNYKNRVRRYLPFKIKRK